MRRFALGLMLVATSITSNSGAKAVPLVATYTGVLFGTTEAFTASFYYDTKDMSRSTDNSAYLQAKSETTQRATYTDPSRSLSFTLPLLFAKGKYDSTVYDDTGDPVEVDTVHDYTIVTSTGLLSLTFGGANDMGIATLDADGTSYVQLDPRSFSLTRNVVSPVPLPSSAPLFAAALLAYGIAGRVFRRSVHIA